MKPSEIHWFWLRGASLAFSYGAAAEFGHALPAELATYLDSFAPLDIFAPAEDVQLDTVGNPYACIASAATAFKQLRIINGERGFNLAPRAAAWLFPRLKTWAGPHYAAWCAAFDNA
jgi:hypothetical protein